MRFVEASLVLVAATGLAGCPGRMDHTDLDAADGSVITDSAVDAHDAPPAVDVPPPPDVPRCGPGAVPYADDAGTCNADVPPPPDVVPGQCTASVSASALLATNAMDGDEVVMPNGRRVQPAMDRIALHGFPMAMLRIPGTPFIAVSDGGVHSGEHLWMIDTSVSPPIIVPNGDLVFTRDGTAREPALFYGLAYDPVAHVLYASGGGSNRIYAVDVAASGALTLDPGRTIDLGLAETSQVGHDADGTLHSGYVAGLALSSDGTQLFAAIQRGGTLDVYSTATAQRTARIGFDTVGGLIPYPYVVATRPGDDRHVYVSLWGSRQVAEVDVTTNSVSQLFAVGKNPEELVFSADGARLYVSASDSDAIDVIDLSMPGAPIETHYLAGSMTALRGVSPTALALGPNGRLYVAESDEDAIDVLDGTTLDRIGRIPTEWYPTDVDVASDGSVFVATGKGLGWGPAAPDINSDEAIRGSLARYDAPTDNQLATGDGIVTANHEVLSGFDSVTCPSGATNDFPVPMVGSTSGSTRIHHVIFVVRENKTYDAVLGDYAGTTASPANGDATLTLYPSAQMAQVFPNLRALVQQFGSLDNYYSNAEQSIQGHVRTTEGRSTDYVERSWHTTWGRGTRNPPDQAIDSVGLAEEGTILNAMEAAHVTAEDWGDPVGNASPTQLAGTRYPGVFWSLNIPDIHKALALGDWTHGTNVAATNPGLHCQLAPFTYFLLPNDHTQGGTAGAPTPLSYFEDNDEGTGYLVDAISHSRFWPDTLIIVVEDDPSTGGDHIDYHRSIALFISPWVRRGYNSHVHADESSLHHTIELILGVPPHNQLVADAAPLYDAFTSTPDYTPFTYTPRSDCPAYNPMNGMWAEASSQMDFDDLDEAEGLAPMLYQMAHEHEPAGPSRAGSSHRLDEREDLTRGQ